MQSRAGNKKSGRNSPEGHSLQHRVRRELTEERLFHVRGGDNNGSWINAITARTGDMRQSVGIAPTWKINLERMEKVFGGIDFSYRGTLGHFGAASN